MSGQVDRYFAEYNRIIHIENTQVSHTREKNPEDSLDQIQPKYSKNEN